MAASMSMALKSLGVECSEDEVADVMGVRPMRGATWEDALAAAQHYGCRATLTVPATITQIKEWTDAGDPVLIAWNPEGREWSHASVVFDVEEDQTVHVADPNIPDPEETVRVVSRKDFYGKWSEKWPRYLVRRPAMRITREITTDGRQVMAASVGTSIRGLTKEEFEDIKAPIKKLLDSPARFRFWTSPQHAYGQVTVAPTRKTDGRFTEAELVRLLDWLIRNDFYSVQISLQEMKAKPLVWAGMGINFYKKASGKAVMANRKANEASRFQTLNTLRQSVDSATLARHLLLKMSDDAAESFFAILADTHDYPLALGGHRMQMLEDALQYMNVNTLLDELARESSDALINSAMLGVAMDHRITLGADMSKNANLMSLLTSSLNPRLSLEDFRRVLSAGGDKAEKDIDKAEKAWKKWDLKTLTSMGLLTKAQADDVQKVMDKEDADPEDSEWIGELLQGKIQTMKDNWREDKANAKKAAVEKLPIEIVGQFVENTAKILREATLVTSKITTEVTHMVIRFSQVLEQKGFSVRDPQAVAEDLLYLMDLDPQWNDIYGVQKMLSAYVSKTGPGIRSAKFEEGKEMSVEEVADYLRKGGNPEAADKWIKFHEQNKDKFTDDKAELRDSPSSEGVTTKQTRNMKENSRQAKFEEGKEMSVEEVADYLRKGGNPEAADKWLKFHEQNKDKFTDEETKPKAKKKGAVSGRARLTNKFPNGLPSIHKAAMQKRITADLLMKTFRDLAFDEAVVLAKSLAGARNSSAAEKTLRLANEILDGHGVEAIYSADDYDAPPVAEYVNQGDTYNVTIVYDRRDNVFYLTDFGTWVDHFESDGGQVR